MRIVLSNQSGVPIYEQIKDQIKAAILSGDLPEGEMLPSIRQLARELKVSVITTTRSYGGLELEGFINTIPGKGCYVLGSNMESVRQHYIQEIETALITAIRQGKTAGLSITALHELLDALEENEK